MQRGFVRAHSFTGHSPIVRTGGYRLLSIAAATLLCISWAIAPVHCTQTLNTGLTDKHDHGEGANLPFGRHPGRGCLQERAAQGTQRPLLYKGAASVGSQQGPAQGRSTSRRRLLSEGLGGSSRDLRVEHPQELGIDILGESLESVRLFIHDQYNRFPPRDEESASSEPSGMGEGFVVCPAQSCPEMTSCQGRGDPTLSSCWNPHLEDMPVRSRPPVVRHFHPWDMNLNALDLCFENVTGAFGDVVRPGCPWKGDWLGGREDGEDPVKWWQEGWAGQVFELHNVYLDSQGRIFNKTHRFDAGGCLPRSKVLNKHRQAFSQVFRRPQAGMASSFRSFRCFSTGWHERLVEYPATTMLQSTACQFLLSFCALCCSSPTGQARRPPISRRCSISFLRLQTSPTTPKRHTTRRRGLRCSTRSSMSCPCSFL